MYCALGENVRFDVTCMGKSSCQERNGLNVLNISHKSQSLITAIDSTRKISFIHLLTVTFGSFLNCIE
jgi:phosphopantetheinyl transferase